MPLIEMTPFAARRHFGGDPLFAGTKIGDHTPEEFEVMANLLAEGTHAEVMPALNPGKRVYFSEHEGPFRHEAPGYAPFCKHLFVRNFTDAEMAVTRITDNNEHLIRTGFYSRIEGEELPVLTRWFRREDLMRLGYRRDCVWLDLVLYSRAQLEKEGMPITGEWGIVSINSETEPKESPMKPITMMRNALGLKAGGSGKPLDERAYMDAVRYWSAHATIRS